MTSLNLKKYKTAFKKTFLLKDEDFKKNIKYNTIKPWDSVGHMTLMGELEEAFSISLEMDDIIDFSSFEKGKKILKKYKITI
jgi:acyl carrier protein